jgi:hypothetical protein
MTFAQQEPSAKAPCTSTTVPIAMMPFLSLSIFAKHLSTCSVAAVCIGIIEQEPSLAQLNEVERNEPAGLGGLAHV